MLVLILKGESVISDETVTAEEREPVDEGDGVPQLNLDEDYADSTARNSARSTLER